MIPYTPERRRPRKENNNRAERVNAQYVVWKLDGVCIIVCTQAFWEVTSIGEYDCYCYPFKQKFNVVVLNNIKNLELLKLSNHYIFLVIMIFYCKQNIEIKKFQSFFCFLTVK